MYIVFSCKFISSETVGRTAADPGGGGGGVKNFEIKLFHFHGKISEFLILVPLNSLNNRSLLLPLIPASFLNWAN